MIEGNSSFIRYVVEPYLGALPGFELLLTRDSGGIPVLFERCVIQPRVDSRTPRTPVCHCYTSLDRGLYVCCCVSSSCLSNTYALRVMTSCRVEMTDPLAHKVCTEHQNACLRYIRMPPSDLAKASARSLPPLTSSLPQVLRSVLGVGVVHLCLYVLLLRFLLCLLPKKSYDNVSRIMGDEGISCRTVERVEDVDIV